MKLHIIKHLKEGKCICNRDPKISCIANGCVIPFQQRIKRHGANKRPFGKKTLRHNEPIL